MVSQSVPGGGGEPQCPEQCWQCQTRPSPGGPGTARGLSGWGRQACAAASWCGRCPGSSEGACGPAHPSRLRRCSAAPTSHECLPWEVTQTQRQCTCYHRRDGLWWEAVALATCLSLAKTLLQACVCSHDAWCLQVPALLSHKTRCELCGSHGACRSCRVPCGLRPLPHTCSRGCCGSTAWFAYARTNLVQQTQCRCPAQARQLRRVSKLQSPQQSRSLTCKLMACRLRARLDSVRLAASSCCGAPCRNSCCISSDTLGRSCGSCTPPSSAPVRHLAHC